MPHEEFHNYLRLVTLLNDYGGNTLRDTFKTRYKFSENTEWVDGSPESQYFHQALGKPVFKRSQCIQKQMLQEGDLQKWDLPLIFAVLQKIDFSKGQAHTKKKHDDENKIIAELILIRNRIQHSPGKHLCEDLFSELWKIAEKSLVSLGVPSEEIEHVRTCKDVHGIEFKIGANEINPENTLKAKALKEEGNLATKSNQLEKAIQFYSQGLNLYGVSPIEQGILYSNRSLVHLKLAEEAKDVEDEAQENLRLAMEDAKAAIDLRPTWWKGYCRLGRVHQMEKNWNLAITVFDQALGLNVEDQEIMKARDACRYHQQSESTDGHLHPTVIFNQTDTEEIFEKMKRERGVDCGTADNMIHLNKIWLVSGVTELRSIGLVFFAQRYMYGTDGFKQDYKKAAEYFQEAADNSYSSGFHNIGLMYHLGRHFSRDVFKAVEYYEKAAKCPMKGFFGSNKIGVIAAQYSIGKCFADGMGKPKDYFEAAEWFTRAAKHGDGDAANSLAFLYRDGLGVERSQQRAIQYWKLAAYRGEPLSLESLASEYVQLQNYTKAEKYFSQAVRSGNTTALLKQKQFQKDIGQGRAEKEKLTNYIGTLDENQKELFNFATVYGSKTLSIMCDPLPLPLTRTQSIEGTLTSKFWLGFQEIRTKAAANFQYAHKILSAMQSFKEGQKYLRSVLNDDLSAISNSEQCKIVRAFSNCCRQADMVAYYFNTEIDKLLEISLSIMKSAGEKKSDADCNARICYARLRSNSMEEVVSFLTMCIKKYPHELYFRNLQTLLLALLNRHDEAMQSLKKSLKQFPRNVELLEVNSKMLYSTHVMSGIQGNWKKAKTAFQKFLQLAPPDHHLIPDAYYCLGFMCLRQQKSIEEAKNYYRLGLEAENNILSCFIPYVSDYKNLLEGTFEFAYESSRWAEKTAATINNSDSSSSPKIENEISILQVDLHSNQLQRTNPMRTFLVLEHRRQIKEIEEIRRRSLYHITSKPLKEQKLPSQLTGLKIIVLDDMDSTLDHIYEGTVLHATIMEDSISDERTCVTSIIKDENGDFMPCFFYNFDLNEETTSKKLSFGSKISIINPYHRLTGDSNWGIRVDDPQSVVFHSTGDEESLCRFCWVGGAQFRCAKCNRVKYCSKECQRQDWELLKHKLICKPRVSGEIIERIEKNVNTRSTFKEQTCPGSS